MMGPCLGGQAYHPIMQDFVFQTRKTGFMGIAGPAFVKTQTGVEITLEELCGIKAHAYKTGQTHVVAEDDKDCLDKTKELLGLSAATTKRKRRPGDQPTIRTGPSPSWTPWFPKSRPGLSICIR